MDQENCEERAREKLKEVEPAASPGMRIAVAKEVCRLLRSGYLEQDADIESPDIEYLISRLRIREGEDNPPLSEKWNYYLGQMGWGNGSKYDSFRV